MGYQRFKIRWHQPRGASIRTADVLFVQDLLGLWSTRSLPCSLHWQPFQEAQLARRFYGIAMASVRCKGKDANRSLHVSNVKTDFAPTVIIARIRLCMVRWRHGRHLVSIARILKKELFHLFSDLQ